MNRRTKRRIETAVLVFNWTLLIGSSVVWPLAALTFAKKEPTTVLHLSFFAIWLTAETALIAIYLKKDQDS